MSHWTKQCPVTDDDNVLAAALEGNCDVIVMGDKDLLVPGQFSGNTNLNSETVFRFRTT